MCQNALFFVRKEKRKQESEVLFQEIRLAESKMSRIEGADGWTSKVIQAGG